MAAAPKKKEINAELVYYQIAEVKKTVDQLLENSKNYVNKPELDKLQLEFDTFKTYVEENYVKRSDNKTVRNIGIIVLAAFTTAVVTAIANFILNGGLRNG